MAGPRSLVLAASLAAAILASSPAASARAPSAADQGSLEWILQKLKRDKEAEQSARPAADPIQAYMSGDSPLEDWKVLAERINNKKLGSMDRDRATSAICTRFKLEDAQQKIEAKALDKIKAAVCYELLELMNANDDTSRMQIHRLLSNLQPGIREKWSTGDSQMERRKAYIKIKAELQKKLKQ